MVITRKPLSLAGSRKNLAVFTFLSIGAVAAVGLRLWQMSGALWYDEAFSAWLAGLPIPQLIEATAGDVHPPAYYLLLWALTHTAGNQEWLLRLPSLLAGLALVWVVWRLGLALRLAPPVVAIAAGITAFAPWQIYYSTEARSYALLTLAVALAGLGLVERRYGLAIAGTLAALYLHNLAAVFVGALWLATAHKSGRTYLAGLITAIFSLPALGWTAMQTLAIRNGYWIPDITPGRVLAAFDDLVFFAPNNPFVLASALITTAALVLIILDLRCQNKVLLISVGLPVLALALFSLWTPVFQSRSIAPIAPFYYLLVADTVLRTPHRRVTFGVLGGAALLLVLLATISPLARETNDGDMMTFYGLEQPGDVLYHANVGSYVVWHYYRPDLPQFLWPQHSTVEQTLSDQTRQAMGMNELDFELVKCAALADGQGRVYRPRWWLIYFNNPVTNSAERAMVDTLLNNYGSIRRSLRNDPTTAAGLVLLNPECN